MNENPIKPVQPHSEKPLPKPLSVRTIKVGRGEFMRQNNRDGSGAFDPGQRTVPPGYRPKVGKFMDGDDD